jgi:hypothetical protein
MYQIFRHTKSNTETTTDVVGFISCKHGYCACTQSTPFATGTILKTTHVAFVQSVIQWRWNNDYYTYNVFTW